MSIPNQNQTQIAGYKDQQKPVSQADLNQNIVQALTVLTQNQQDLQTQLKKGLFTDDDRKFLYKLVSRFVLPLISNAITGNGAVVLAAGVSATVLEDNAQRWSCTVTNSAAGDAYLNFWQGPTLNTTGLLLRANGGSITFGRGTDIPYNGRVTGFSTGGTTLTYVEFNIPIQELEF
jgi:hypothetical protein